MYIESTYLNATSLYSEEKKETYLNATSLYSEEKKENVHWIYLFEYNKLVFWREKEECTSNKPIWMHVGYTINLFINTAGTIFHSLRFITFMSVPWNLQSRQGLRNS